MIAPNYFSWPGKVWVFSDPHFGDRGILTYERTQFANPDEHNEFILNIINKTVQTGDTLVCLGDLGQKWEDSIIKIKPCAKKVLVMGNHDHDNKTKYRKYFDEVYPGPLFVNKFTILSHEPIPVSEHFLNIHGHLHNSYLDDDHHINVSIAMAGYKLFPLDESYNRVQNYPRIRAKFLEEWYADKYIFTDTRKDCLFYSDTLHVVPRENIISALKTIELLLEDDPTKKEEILHFYDRKLFKDVDVKLNTKSSDTIEALALDMIKTWETISGNKIC